MNVKIRRRALLPVVLPLVVVVDLLVLAIGIHFAETELQYWSNEEVGKVGQEYREELIPEISECLLLAVRSDCHRFPNVTLMTVREAVANVSCSLESIEPSELKIVVDYLGDGSFAVRIDLDADRMNYRANANEKIVARRVVGESIDDWVIRRSGNGLRYVSNTSPSASNLKFASRLVTYVLLPLAIVAFLISLSWTIVRLVQRRRRRPFGKPIQENNASDE